MTLVEFKKQIDRLADHFHECAHELEVVVSTRLPITGGVATRPIVSIDRVLELNRNQIVIQPGKL